MTDRKIADRTTGVNSNNSSIYPIASATKMATELDKLFHAFFLFQKLIKYNFLKLMEFNWIDT